MGPENTDNTCIATALDERKYPKNCSNCSIAQTPRGYPFVNLKVKSGRIKQSGIQLYWLKLNHSLNLTRAVNKNALNLNLAEVSCCRRSLHQGNIEIYPTDISISKKVHTFVISR